MMNANAAPDEAEESAPVPDPDAQQEGSEQAASSSDTGPLESMDIQPAEHGAFVVKHHPKASARVKHMDHESMRTKTHAIKDHKELVKHIEKHSKRLRP